MQGIKQLHEQGEFDNDSKVVVIFPDHGSRYISTVYSDKWMATQGFFDSKHQEDPQRIEFIK